MVNRIRRIVLKLCMSAIAALIFISYTMLTEYKLSVPSRSTAFQFILFTFVYAMLKSISIPHSLVTHDLSYQLVARLIIVFKTEYRIHVA